MTSCNNTHCGDGLNADGWLAEGSGDSATVRKQAHDLCAFQKCGPCDFKNLRCLDRDREGMRMRHEAEMGDLHEKGLTDREDHRVQHEEDLRQHAYALPLQNELIQDFYDDKLLPFLTDRMKFNVVGSERWCRDGGPLVIVRGGKGVPGGQLVERVINAFTADKRVASVVEIHLHFYDPGEYMFGHFSIKVVIKLKDGGVRDVRLDSRRGVVTWARTQEGSRRNGRGWSTRRNRKRWQI